LLLTRKNNKNSIRSQENGIRKPKPIKRIAKQAFKDEALHEGEDPENPKGFLEGQEPRL
jgi:hypothetical protein